MQDNSAVYDRNTETSISILSDFSIVDALPYIRAIGIVTTLLFVWAVI
jgi:hypothetical protein